MIKAVIVDDEVHSIETLKWKIENYCEGIQIVKTFSNPVDAVEFLKKEDIDLLFLDIEMPMLSGFDVLLETRDYGTFDVIFTTAHDSFGIKAIKYSALDYLLKPVQNNELIEAVDKHKQSRNPEIIRNKISHLPENLQAEQQKLPAKIGLASKENIEFVTPQDIQYCEASSNYTNVFLKDGSKRIISKTLKEFENMLGEYGFLRSHNSYLVNLSLVSEYVRQEGGYLVMESGKQIPVSKNRKDELLRKLKF